MNQPAQWDIASGVGVTALMVAAARAIETHRTDRLVADPYAQAFVRAGAYPVPLPTRLDADTDPAVPWAAMATYLGVRSKFFDEFATSAMAGGADQVVVLAAGLDTRAFRLDFPADTTVYELDMPRVLEFKERVLADEGARPRCRRRAVPVDLREDWPSALRQAGFDPTRRTAWVAEGLLLYLLDEAKESLLSRMNDLSAAGSAIAVEHISSAHDLTVLAQDPLHRNMAEKTGVDLAALWATSQDFEPEQWLADHGWAVSASPAPALAQRCDRPLDDTTPQPMKFSVLITAESPSL
ncbi:MAG: class I SAM-dependent methyltransferase [Kutzneria sp.]|nr:class I SAM-dependent methyltransferase [Kutzneria sp.]MBV9847217.1 class I SAM-dependent methyltransferase [Kutzneria sp.]